MSILFEALNKAAQDVRQQQHPAVIPLAPACCVPSYRRRPLLFVAIGVCFFTLGALTVHYAARRLAPEYQETQSAQQANTRDVVASEGRMPAKGIEVEEASLAANQDKDDGAVSVLTRSLDDVPALDVEDGLKKQQEGSIYLREDDIEEPESLSKTTTPIDRALAKEDWAQAIRLYDRKLRDSRGDQSLLAGLAYALEKRGSEQDGSRLDDLCEMYPSLAFLHASRGRLLARQNDTKEAIRALRRAVELAPQSDENRLSLAVLLDQTGADKEAFALYKSLPQPVEPSVAARKDYLGKRLLLEEQGQGAPEPQEE